jgi:hypothetical protein
LWVIELCPIDLGLRHADLASVGSYRGALARAYRPSIVAAGWRWRT